ncbi:MAG TPA: HAD family hydrolase [Phycisphaerae bacterium]|nr:HAD family hydrolase [Phycisphaerae bacterium]
MRPRLLALDYDGTLAEDGAISPPTLEALAKAKRAGFLLGLVTGRPHDELLGICPEIGLFDLVVDENGSVLHFPGTGEVEDLGPSPPERFAEELGQRAIRHSRGRVVVRTWRPHLQEALAVIRDLGLALDVIPNKYAVMIVPRGIDKGTGLAAGLERLGVTASETVAVGDDENDRAMFRVAALGVAVANAVEVLKAEADLVLERPSGAGVAGFIRERLLRTPETLRPSRRGEESSSVL